MAKPFLLKKAFGHVTELLSGLPSSMYFHNIMHTHYVFLVATEIALESNLPPSDIQLLQFAALFHDTGYLYDYEGHEEKSELIAANFFLQENYPMEMIDSITAAIDTTRVPQAHKMRCNVFFATQIFSICLNLIILSTPTCCGENGPSISIVPTTTRNGNKIIFPSWKITGI